ncbi:MAG TPA: 5-deoxy-glucuronate isomerase [Bacillota bacterium]|nr:5-deoxy-glucuronate isomerase [Bacillota bacterium]HOA34770.1 5-deoxy-glucuronate isomerase [Bacillota bacterium]HOJ84588.1 5-deoxy-glucuronate isomerase [Bacillota bacterium]HOL15968.1 5-deoxy-glucuronate isomerase [Bacillota bacterium]HPZ12200.1 5-deoxy-glucuronate isomerase [Bacillota bacterium]
MKFKYDLKEYKGYAEIVPPAEAAGLLSFGLIQLEKGESFSSHSEGFEIGLVILSGKADVYVEGQEFLSLGSRENVFSGKATTVYIPRDSVFKVVGADSFEGAVCKVRAEKKLSPFVLAPGDVKVENRGKNLWQRVVYDIFTDNVEGRVDRIVLGETINVPGHWSGYPPHKHDQFVPGRETAMHEIYHFRLEPRDRFGVQMWYTDGYELGNAYLIKDGDSCSIPFGYHPVAAPPGVKLYYLWCMAGTGSRQLLPNDDPNFAELHK